MEQCGFLEWITRAMRIELCCMIDKVEGSVSCYDIKMELVTAKFHLVPGTDEIKGDAW